MSAELGINAQLYSYIAILNIYYVLCILYKTTTTLQNNCHWPKQPLNYLYLPYNKAFWQISMELNKQNTDGISWSVFLSPPSFPIWGSIHPSIHPHALNPQFPFQIRISWLAVTHLRSPHPCCLETLYPSTVGLPRPPIYSIATFGSLSPTPFVCKLVKRTVGWMIQNIEMVNHFWQRYMHLISNKHKETTQDLKYMWNWLRIWPKCSPRSAGVAFIYSLWCNQPLRQCLRESQKPVKNIFKFTGTQ